MLKKLVKFIFVLIYLLVAFFLLALHGYFVYNSQQFPLTNYYWWLLTPILIWILWKLKIPSKVTFLLGLAVFLFGAVIRMFSAIGEISLNTGLIIIVLSLFNLNLMNRKFSLLIYLLLFLGITVSITTSHQGISQKMMVVLYVYLIICFIAYGKNS